jgi:hypothetical protein
VLQTYPRSESLPSLNLLMNHKTYPRSPNRIYIVAASLIEGVVDRDAG